MAQPSRLCAGFGVVAGAMLAALLAFRGVLPARLPGGVPAADVDARGLVG
jgi:hypothetical protein